MTILDVAALQALPEDDDPALSFDPVVAADCCSYTCGTNSCGSTCPPPV
jgi:hypothetical protein